MVFLAKNWKGYSSGESGFLCGFAGLDFITSILLYLMIVVKYDYWWDAARAVMLVGLHTAASAVFTKYGLHWPCDSFGSSEHCHQMSLAVLVGSWILTAFLIAYGITLPVVACVRKPEEPISNVTEEYGNANREEKRTLVPSASRDSLHPPELPQQPHAHSFEDTRTSSVSASIAHHQPDASRLIESLTTSESMYSTPSIHEDATNLNPMARLYTPINTAAIRSTTPPFLRPRGTLIQEERPLSLISGAADGPSATAAYEFPIYPGSRQTSVARPSTSTRTYSLSGARTYSSPLITGNLEKPETYFDEIILSNDLQESHTGRSSEPMVEDRTLPPPPPTALSHSRSDSSGSVDVDQWRKLVTDAANGTR